MSEIGVGKEILSHCNKCKLSLAHIIVTMKDLKTPDKVMCKTCKGTHGFKDASAKVKTSVAKMTRPSSAPKKATVSVAELWTKALNQTTKSPIEYSIKGSFAQGDLITHPNFGQGIVERLIDQNKIEVLFQDDYRTLIHRK